MGQIKNIKLHIVTDIKFFPSIYHYVSVPRCSCACIIRTTRHQMQPSSPTENRVVRIDFSVSSNDQTSSLVGYYCSACQQVRSVDRNFDFSSLCTLLHRCCGCDG